MKRTGTQDPFEHQHTWFEYSDEEGRTEHELSEGSRAQILAEFDTQANFASDVGRMVAKPKTKAEQGNWSLEVIRTALQTSEEENTIWELFGAQKMDNVRTFPPFKNRSNISITELQAIEKALDNRTVYSSGNALAQELYNWLAGGTETYLRFMPVLTRTVRRNKNNANFGQNLLKTNQVITFGGQEEDEADPPSDVISGLNSLPYVDTDGTFKTGSYEWLKMQPRQRIDSKGAVEIHYEYWGDRQWAKRFYNGTLLPT